MFLLNVLIIRRQHCANVSVKMAVLYQQGQTIDQRLKFKDKKRLEE